MDERTKFRRRLATLIEISAEMSLNAEDGLFSRARVRDSESKIYYVFDQNVFEFFVNPDSRTRKYSALFHQEEWRDESMDPEDYWILVNEMHAVQTAEYLLSGSLPGQEDHLVLMTSTHKHQTAQSYSVLVSECVEKYRTPGAVKARRDAVARLRHGKLDPCLLDLRLTEDLTGMQPLRRSRYLKARALSQTFAVDRLNFVPDQLQRWADKIWPNVVELSRVFPLTDSDRADIADEQLRWQQRIEEAKLSLASRKETNVKADAEAIASVQHIARHLLDRDERIVFVTGDRAILTAYWKWYGEEYLVAPWEAKTVRSLKGFTPLLNIAQLLKGDEASEADRVPFARIQVAANLALQPFNMSIDLKDQYALSDEELGRLWWLRQKVLNNPEREHIFDDPLFSTISDDYLIAELDDEFREVRDVFQGLERRASRAALDLLRARRQFILQGNVQVDGTDSAGAMEEFANEAEQLIRRVISVWYPLAREMIRERTERQPAKQEILRTPINISLRVPVGRTGKELVNIAKVESSLASLSTDDLDRPEILAHLIFVIGAIAAVRARRYGDAARYASLAKDAFRATSDHPVQALQHDDYLELRYLHAVTLRLQLGSARPEGLGPKAKGQNTVWRKLRDLAEVEIGECIRAHAEGRSPLRLARAYAERASIRLFSVVRDRQQIGKAAVDRTSKSKFIDAVYDLMKSYEIVRTTEIDNSEMDRIELRDKLFAHLMATVAAVDCLAVRLPYLEDDWRERRDQMSQAAEEAATFLPKADPQSFPVIVRREVVDFLTRRDLAVPPAWRNREGVSIAIDAEIGSLMSLPTFDGS